MLYLDLHWKVTDVSPVHCGFYEIECGPHVRMDGPALLHCQQMGLSRV